MRRRDERLAAGVAGIVGVGLGAALVLGGVRQPDVLTAVTHAALGVAVAACGAAILLGGAVGFAAAMSGIAVTLAVAGFVVGGPLGVTAGLSAWPRCSPARSPTRARTTASSRYALLGDGLATAALGTHHLRTGRDPARCDAARRGRCCPWHGAAVVGKAAQ